MMGLYTMALCAGAAVAAGATVPLQHALGDSWALALAAWAVPALIAAAAAWSVQLGCRGAARSWSRRRAPEGLWRVPLAWQVTLFVGLQSSLAYSIFAWLPPILRARAFPPIRRGPDGLGLHPRAGAGGAQRRRLQPPAGATRKLAVLICVRLAR